MDHNVIHICYNLCILQNVMPDFIDTNNCPLRMFPASFLLPFILLDFIRSNTFGIAFKKSRQIKLLSADVNTVNQLFLSNFTTYLQQSLHDPPDPLKRGIFCIDLHAVNILVSHGKILSSPYSQDGFFLDENNTSYF